MTQLVSCFPQYLHLDINSKLDLESQKTEWYHEYMIDDLLVDKLNFLVISRFLYVN